MGCCSSKDKEDQGRGRSEKTLTQVESNVDTFKGSTVKNDLPEVLEAKMSFVNEQTTDRGTELSQYARDRDQMARDSF